MSSQGILIVAATFVLACGRSELEIDESRMGGAGGVGAVGGSNRAGGAGSSTDGGSTGGTAGAHDGGAGAHRDAGGVVGCGALVIEETADVPQASLGDLTLRLVFSRANESKAALVRNRYTGGGPGPKCKPGIPNPQCFLGHYTVDALELDSWGSWATLGEPTFITGYGRRLAVGSSMVEGFALLHPTRKYNTDPAEMRFAPHVDASSLPLQSVSIDSVDGFGLFVARNDTSSFLAYHFTTEPAGASRFTRYGYFANGVFSPASDFGCAAQTSLVSGAAQATEQGFLFALSSGVAGGACQTESLTVDNARRVQVIWTPDPSTYTPTVDLDTGADLLVVRMVRRSSGAWVMWVHDNSTEPKALMGLRVDAQGKPQSAPQVLIPSFGIGESLAYTQLGALLIVAHRSTESLASADEIALHVFDDAGSELFVTKYAPPTGSLGGQITLLGHSDGQRLLLAHDWIIPAANSWDPSEEGSTLVRFVCSASP